MNVVRPSYGLNGIDRIVARTVNKRNGFFVEIGANDGVNQSNTLLLEQRYNWRGLLIEPVPALFERCRANRPKAIVANYACVDPVQVGGGTIAMTACDQFSFVTDLLTPAERDSWLSLSQKFQPTVMPYEVKVLCKTLSEVLSEHLVARIDLLSLDVEGAELQVLKGLDRCIHAPTWILVEINRTGLRSILDELRGEYELIGTYFGKDALLRRKAIL